MTRREKENNIPWQNATKRKSSSSHPKSKKSQTKNKTQMHTKNNTDQQIIPTHNKKEQKACKQMRKTQTQFLKKNA